MSVASEWECRHVASEPFDRIAPFSEARLGNFQRSRRNIQHRHVAISAVKQVVYKRCFAATDVDNRGVG